MHQLSRALYGKNLCIRDFPKDRSITGMGTSDWVGFAPVLARKFRYTNTYYDSEPRLDLTKPPPPKLGQFDFIICSEVLEHVAPPVQPAFDGLNALLKPGGVALITVPFQIDKPTIEHFPNLCEWTVCSVGGRDVLVNRRRDGEYEVFDQLAFHSGRGLTLEMRIFGRDDLLANLSAAGFETHIVDEPCEEFGIHWAVPWSLPIVATKPRPPDSPSTSAVR